MLHLGSVFSCMPHPIAAMPGVLQLELVSEIVAVMRHIEGRCFLKPTPFLSQGGNMTVQVGAFSTPMAQDQHPVFWIDLRPSSAYERNGQRHESGVFAEMRWWPLEPNHGRPTVRQPISSVDEIDEHYDAAFRGYLVKRNM